MRKRVVPLCYRGLKISEIPTPLSWLQAVAPQGTSSLSHLVATIAGAFDLREPTVDYERLRRLIDGRYEWQESPVPGPPARRPLPVFVILDASGSMAGERITVMRTGLTKLVDYLQSPEHAIGAPLLSIISYGGEARLVLEMRPVEEVGTIPEIEAGGGSSLGAALRLLTGVFSDPTRMPGRSLPPVVVVVLDGEPTDDWESALSAFRETEWGRRALTLCLALGEDVDYKILRMIGNEAVLPLRNPEDLLSVTKFVRWASTAVISAAAAGSKGGELAVPPPPTQKDGEVW